MIYRSPTPADISTVLTRRQCSDEVICKALRSFELIVLLLALKSFDKVAIGYLKEYQFFEDHVLQYEVTFKNFYNDLLDMLRTREDDDLENEDTDEEYGGFEHRN